MLRKTVAVLGVILLLAPLTIGTQYIASESGEVVVLQTRDAAGAVYETRLWVVDHDGSAWLRAGNPDSGWYPRLVANPEIVLVRGNETRVLRAVPAPEARDAINDLMQAKYGWADSYISFYFPRSKKLAVRLTPATGAP